MGEQTQHLGILFADICNSVRLYDRLGDTEAHRVVQDCINRLVDITERHDGTVIRTQGNGVMSTFGSADAAYEAAMEMQDAYRDGPVTITAGFNFGEVIPEGGDVYGDAVNLAARVSALARSGEILLTGETVERLSPPHRASVRLFDTTTVRGRAKAVEIYAVVADQGGQTTMVPFATPPEQTRQLGALTLAYGDSDTRMGEAIRSLVVGRDERCDLVVRSYFASRRHAVIEAKRDRYILTDQSANGTFVVAQNGREVYLKRESLPLLGSGTISLGAAPTAGDNYTIRFTHDSDG